MELVTLTHSHPHLYLGFLVFFPSILFLAYLLKKEEREERERYVEGRKYLILQHIYSGTKKNARGKTFTSDLTGLLIVADKNGQRKVIGASGIQSTPIIHSSDILFLKHQQKGETVWDPEAL